MKRVPVQVKFPSSDDETIAPVTIYDAEGHVVRVVPALVFHPPGATERGRWHERRRRSPRSIPAEVQL
jgi:hypothetical protein